MNHHRCQAGGADDDDVDDAPDKDLYIEQAGPTAISSRGALQWGVVA